MIQKKKRYVFFKLITWIDFFFIEKHMIAQSCYSIWWQKQKEQMKTESKEYSSLAASSSEAKQSRAIRYVKPRFAIANGDRYIKNSSQRDFWRFTIGDQIQMLNSESRVRVANFSSCSEYRRQNLL